MDVFTNESCLNFYYNFILSEQPKEFNNYLPFLQKPEVSGFTFNRFYL